MQEQVGITTVKCGSGQEVGADHLQAVAPRLVRSQHQSRGLERLLDHRNLALVELEIHDLRQFRVFSGQLCLNLPADYNKGSAAPYYLKEIGEEAVNRALCKPDDQ